MKRGVLIIAGILTAVILSMAHDGLALGNETKAVDTTAQINKQRKALRELRNLGVGVGWHIGDMGQAPAIDFHASIRRYFEANRIPVPSARDPWGNAYIYLRDKKDPQDYSLACAGSDGKFKGWGQSGAYVMEDLDDFGQDIIFSNGEFTFAPTVKKSGGQQGPDPGKMDRQELIDRYYDLRIRQVEIDRLVHILDDLESGLRSIEGKTVRIELLKLEQRRTLKILENIFSVVAPANSFAKEILLNGDLLDMNIVVPMPGVIDPILRGLEANGSFTQIRLAQKPENTSSGKTGTVISCRYNFKDAGAEPMFASAARKDYQWIGGRLAQKLKEADAPPARRTADKAEGEAIEGLARREVIRRIGALEQHINKAESHEHRLAGIRRKYEEFRDRLEKWKGILPDRSEMEKIRLELLSMIQESGVALVDSRALSGKTSGSLVECPFAFSIKGDYARLRCLFDQLASAKHIFVLKQFKLRQNREAPGTGELKVEMIVSFALHGDPSEHRP